ncbi:hypothetical protein [Acinetobacter baumannii]|uniref:hypothetical protein n=1 Tax=Acinetobacter baumannii TaxID=470 RepID=UPI000B0925A3|nr:hypothetical protein [Acinetobacter baumannii]MDC5264371.1 hypothetical protein [Acinetobacter baumannii]MDN8251898.1 hypothetical protein [Acinetobacter baumannii]MDU4063030.1 hypothetical protein [Acinetobacter baumannii]MDU7564170.1 hypothetical protein [Acinetobacter baumannii]MDV4231094.1 hypothetical protein [Acinetobacter baumannii]
MKIHEFGLALFGEHYSANQFAKILINKDGSNVDRKTIQNWINRDQELGDWVVEQLKTELVKREDILNKLLTSLNKESKMKNLTILSKVTKDAKATAKYDESLKSGDVITYRSEDGVLLEGVVSFAKKWESQRYSNLPVVEIIK